MHKKPVASLKTNYTPVWMGHTLNISNYKILEFHYYADQIKQDIRIINIHINVNILIINLVIYNNFAL